jgi:hypothetical protein
MGAFAAVALLTLALPGATQPVSPVVHPQSSKARITSQAPTRWVRKEGRFWTYYVPDAKWGAIQNASGIDITDPVGDLYMGHGMVAAAGPISYAQLRDFAAQAGTLDAHPVKDLKFGPEQPPKPNGPGIKRYHQDFTGFRTDTNVPMRGHFTADIVDDRTNFLFGYSAYTRTAPADQYEKWGPVLEQMEHLLFYHPQSPVTP